MSFLIACYHGGVLKRAHQDLAACDIPGRQQSDQIAAQIASNGMEDPTEN